MKARLKFDSRFALLVVGVVLAVQALVIASAQGLETFSSVREWGSNPIVFTAALVAIVAMLRDGPFAFVKGRIAVFLLASVIGVIAGALFQLVHLLAVAPFNTWVVPFGGIAYGEAAAVTAFLGMNLFDFLGARNVETRVEAAAAATADLPLVIAPAHETLVTPSAGNAIQSFIIGLAQSAVSALKLPAALAAIAPLLTQFAMSDAVLSDPLRNDLQGRVLHLLREAGLKGRDL